MKHLMVVAALAALIFWTGCGGGGSSTGGGNGGNGGTSGNVSNVFVEAVFAGTNTPIDLMNVLVGQQVQLRLMGFNDSGILVATSSSGWSTTAPPSVATLAGNTLTGQGPSGGTTYSVTGTKDGVNYSAPLQVKNQAAIVTAFARTLGGTPVRFAKISFYDAAGNLVSEGRSLSNGQIRAIVPTSATTFMVDAADARVGLNFKLYNQFLYGSDSWGPICGNSRPALPALAAGQTTALPNQIVFQVLVENDPNSPPPPPPGCGF